jgi:hypothetical protein
VKAAALKRNLVDKVPASEICEEMKLQPSVFYTWQRQLFENADVALADSRSRASSRERKLEAEVAALQARLARKDSVIAEITEEHVKLKKAVGEL